MTRRILRSKAFWILLVLFIILLSVLLYNQWKSLPEGTSHESDVHNADVEFLRDLTFKTKTGKVEHDTEIFPAVFHMIGQAKDFIVVDMFLFNEYKNESREFPKLSEKLTDKLIKQKRKYPDLQIVFITDPVNNGYHSYTDKNIKKLQKHDVKVITANLDRLRDSNPIYSAVWRTFFRWFGQKGKGWLPNALGSGAPKVTARSYLELLNQKADHRKMIATENAAIITSANPDNESGFFIRWYDSNKDQFHGKLLYVKKGKKAVLIGGAANYTTRNLDNYNLENAIDIKASRDKSVMKDVEQYFRRLWNNQGGIFTADYKKFQDKKTPYRKAVYWIQKITDFTTY